MLYPQSGDRIVTIDTVTSLHRMYTYKKVMLVNSNCFQLEEDSRWMDSYILAFAAAC